MTQDFKPTYQVSLDFIKSPDSEWYNQEIEEKGFHIVPGIPARFYCAPLIAFLLSKEVAVTIRTTKSLPVWSNIENEDGSTIHTIEKPKEVEVKAGIICGQEYISSYLAGYNEGDKWFKEYISDPLYKESEEKIRVLHNLYYQGNSDGLRAGIERAKYSFDLFISHENIKEQGYRAGIIAGVDELKGKYPLLFKDWDKLQKGSKELLGDSRKNNDDTHRRAVQAVSIFTQQIDTIVRREKGKRNPLPVKAVVSEAINNYSLLGGTNLGMSEKSLNRYIKDTGKTQTAREYGGQVVRQLRQHN